MTISFVGAASAAANTLTLPNHAAGDMIVAVGWNPGTTPVLPGDWRYELVLASFSQRMLLGTKVCRSSSESFGTWGNAINVGAVVLRSSGSTLHSGSAIATASSGTNVIYPVISNRINYTNKWVVAFASYTTADTTIELPPLNLTFRSGAIGTGEIAVFDSNQNLDWATQRTVAITGTSGTFATALIEIFETGYAPAGGFRPVNIRGGADQ